jgi:hypothetical protein
MLIARIYSKVLIGLKTGGAFKILINLMNLYTGFACQFIKPEAQDLHVALPGIYFTI